MVKEANIRSQFCGLQHLDDHLLLSMCSGYKNKRGRNIVLDRYHVILHKFAEAST